MSSKASKLLEQALDLSKGERDDIAARLIASLDNQSDDASEAWDAEIQRRLGDVDSGRVQPIVWPEARRKILDGADGPPAP